MVDTPAVTRRSVLQITGATVGIGLAGCTGGSESSQTTEASAHDDDPHTEDESRHHEEGEHGHETAIGNPVEHATVKMVSTDDGYHFTPHVVRVKQGGTVTFVNENGSHSATAYHPDNDAPRRVPEESTGWDSGVLSESGAEFEHTFEVEGVYDYYCTPHENLGMIGSIIVGEPDAHGQPGLKPPQESLPSTSREKITSLNERCDEALDHSHDE